MLANLFQAGKNVSKFINFVVLRTLSDKSFLQSPCDAVRWVAYEFHGSSGDACSFASMDADPLEYAY